MIVSAGVKLERAAKALGLWVKTDGQLVAASDSFVADLGEKAVCVGGLVAAGRGGQHADPGPLLRVDRVLSES